MKRAIVGGGMLGCTLALELARRGDEVTLFESAEQLGGLASAWTIGDVAWDRHYHVTLMSDANTRWVIEQLGLGDEFEWVETRTGVFADGALYSVSNTMEFLKFPPLRLIDKVRLGATIVWGSRVRNWEKLDDVPVERWLTRWSGRRTFEKFWRPLLMAKLGDAYRDASAAFIWATIQRLYAARRSGMKKELFGYVRGGYARVLERFGDVLRNTGVKVSLGVPVATVHRDGTRTVVVLADESRHEFDDVVITTDTPTVAKLIPELSERERAELAAQRYQGIVCVSVLLRRPLAGYYLTNITDDAPFTGVVEMTALVNPEQFGGHTLVYLPKYVAPDDPLFAESDDAIRAAFVPALGRMFGITADDVVAFEVSRVRRVFVLPILGSRHRRPPMRTSIAGVHVVTSAQIANGTLNVDETVALARRAAVQLSGQEVHA